MLSRAQALEDLDVLILLDWQRAANASPRQTQQALTPAAAQPQASCAPREWRGSSSQPAM
jgi:hypothetical protein